MQVDHDRLCVYVEGQVVPTTFGVEITVPSFTINVGVDDSLKHGLCCRGTRDTVDPGGLNVV